MQPYTANIRVMLSAARKTSKKLARDFGELENLQVSKKGTKDFVTSADLKAEKILISELSKARPEFSIISEESGVIKGTSSEFCWIIDPLDGTSNFMHGFPFFCTTIALAKILPDNKFDIIAGVTQAPISGEVFYAEKGHGSWLETYDNSGEKKITVSNHSMLSRSLLSVGSFSSDFSGSNGLVNEFMAVRCSGSTALSLAYLAAGRVDCFVHKNAKIWDLAAGFILVNEARGIAFGTDGKNVASTKNGVIATNMALYDVITQKLNKNLI